MSLDDIEKINDLEPKSFKLMRKSLGLTQAELADLLGITSQSVMQKENNRAPIARLETLAMLYLESVADRSELFSVSDSLQAASVAVERYASNAKLRALKTPIVDILEKPVGSICPKGGAK